ncbi:QueT transporter family protein [Irregularibacter muris]|uniref:QueT transporter family protein n=1 Tax=Irregularibacter muris TaxID=1796619 RepID=A0AAE3HEE2_9FIRM|nr:QueT transporter family protein [Irregularibacter muris]MCR1899001.1 QueT transporter family protein [Irregularibacter muris]
MNRNIRLLTTGAIIAAIYVVVTIALAPLSYGPLQIRISEALTVLPYFTPAAIPGLFIGCIIANFNSPLGMLDVIVGSLATLLAAFITWKIKDKRLVPLPSIVVNAIVVPFVLKYTLGAPYLPSMLWVALGQAIACYGLGYPLLLVFKNKSIFSK